MKIDYTSLGLPDSLIKQLKGFEKHLYKIETTIAAFGGACGFSASFCLLFLSDRFWDTPMVVRAGLTLGGAAFFAIFAYVWTHHWVLRRRNIEGLARLVQRRHRRLGDRLLGIVELAKNQNDAKNVSESLRQAAILQVANEASSLDFTEAMSGKRSRGWITACILLGALSIFPFVILPQAGWATLQRWANPMSETSRFTFIDLDDLRNTMIVAHGEEFSLPVSWTKHSMWSRVGASYHFVGQARTTVKTSNNSAVFTIPGQVEERKLVLTIGDVTQSITIIPRHRPDINKLAATITLPDYLGYPDVEVDILGDTVETLVDSKITIRARVSRDIKGATVALMGLKTKLEVDGPRFSTEPFTVATNMIAGFQWTDVHGLVQHVPLELKLNTRNDEVPFVECESASRMFAILEDEVVNIKIKASDDYGLKELGVDWTWRTMNTEVTNAVTHHDSVTLTTGTNQTTELKSEFEFSSDALNIPNESLVELRAYTYDYYPDRAPSYSLVYKIYVLSRAQHAKILLQKFESLQDNIEEMTHTEEDLLAENRQINKQEKADIESEQSTAKLDEQKQGEKANRNKMAKAAEKGKELVKEAMRNKDISEETIRKWAEMMQKMENLANQDMQASTKSVQKAQQEKGAEERKKNLDEAIKKQEEIIKKMAAMQKEGEKAIQDTLAESFVNRLRGVATKETGINTQFKELYKETVGQDFADLNATSKETIELMAGTQKQQVKESRYIRDDLAGFFNRTRKQVYDDVYKDMRENLSNRAWEGLEDDVANNRGYRAITNTLQWAKQFNEWADQIDPKKDQKDGEPSEQEQIEVDMEVFLALLRARQEEEDIRKLTRNYDADPTGINYGRNTRKLARRQQQASRDVQEIETRIRHPKLLQFVQKIDGEMLNVSVRLRAPQTGAGTVAIETEIIELLSQASQEAQAGASSAAQAQMMQMMMQMMMGPAGNTPGQGNKNPYLSNAQNGETSGDGTTDTQGDRSVEQTQGRVSAETPIEFRSALEGYFNQVDEIEQN